jgi:hypothetical protein
MEGDPMYNVDSALCYCIVSEPPYRVVSNHLGVPGRPRWRQPLGASVQPGIWGRLFLPEGPGIGRFGGSLREGALVGLIRGTSPWGWVRVETFSRGWI